MRIRRIQSLEEKHRSIMKARIQQVGLSVALFWLKACEDQITRGLNPAKLSVQVEALVAATIDESCDMLKELEGHLWTTRRIRKAERTALAEARSILMNTTRFPLTRKHFTTVVIHS